MGLLGRWFGSTQARSTEFDRLAIALDGFAAASMANIPEESFGRHPRKQRNAIAFHFGAADYLARSAGFGETETLALYVRFLQGYPLVAPTGAGSVTQYLDEFARDDERKRYRQEGGETMQQWMLGGNNDTPKRLSEMLRLIQG